MQTVTLTLSVPDDVASRFHALPADTINRFAVAVLPGLLDALDEVEESDEADTAQTGFDAGDDFPADIFLTHPLPVSLTEPLTETARKVNADIEAGRIIDGDTFLAEMRTLTGRMV